MAGDRIADRKAGCSETPISDSASCGRWCGNIPSWASSGGVARQSDPSGVPYIVHAVSYPDQFSTLYAKVGVRVDGGTLKITNEFGTVVASGPATQTLIVPLGEYPCPNTYPCTPLGVHYYVAHYSGSALFNGAVSPTVTTESVLFPAVTGSVGTLVNPVPVGHAVSFYIRTSALEMYSSRFAPSGTVTLYDGSTVIGAASLVPGIRMHATKIRVGGLMVGSHTITAMYSGNADYPPGPLGTMTLVVAAG